MTSKETEIDEGDLWAMMIRDAQITAITHGTAFLKFTYVDHTIHVECLKPEDYMPWHMLHTSEKLQ